MKQLSMDYDAIKAKAEEFGVPSDWALNQYEQYLLHLQYYYKQSLENSLGMLKTIKRFGGFKWEGALAKLNIANKLLCVELLKRHTIVTSKLIKELSFRLKKVQPGYKPKEGSITDEMVEHVRAYPIEELLPNPVKHNKTSCPFHDDQNPSMGIKNNYAHCFACNKTWDTIALVRELHSLNFVESVKYLNEQVS